MTSLSSKLMMMMMLLMMTTLKRARPKESLLPLSLPMAREVDKTVLKFDFFKRKRDLFAKAEEMSKNYDWDVAVVLITKADSVFQFPEATEPSSVPLVVPPNRLSFDQILETLYLFEATDEYLSKQLSQNVAQESKSTEEYLSMLGSMCQIIEENKGIDGHVDIPVGFFENAMISIQA